MKRNVKFNSDEIFDIEDHFFMLDKKNKEANFILEFKSPSEIFDNNCKTKIPMLSDDFSEWISCAIDYTPINYKVNLNVYFEDLEGYTLEELNDIFMKNMALEFKHSEHNLFSKNRLYNFLKSYSSLFSNLLTILLSNNLISLIDKPPFNS